MTNKELIVSNKKFKLLTAEPNWKDILYNEETWYTYFTWYAAERECKKQWLSLFKNIKEVEEFIDAFEWETEQEKILDIVNKMWLKKLGIGILIIRNWPM